MPDLPSANEVIEVPNFHQFMLPNHEQLNLRLRPLLLDMAEKIPDKGTNKTTGESYFSNKWLSGRGLHKLPDPAVQSLVIRIEEEANRYRWQKPPRDGSRYRIFAMWSIVSRNGMEGKPHVHGGGASGADHVEGGACTEDNGAFIVYSAQGEVQKVVTPKTGMMLLFPSDMWHGVRRYESDAPRIVLSFNVA